MTQEYGKVNTSLTSYSSHIPWSFSVTQSSTDNSYMEFVNKVLSKLHAFVESLPGYVLYPLASYGVYRTLRIALAPVAGFWRYKLRGIPNLLGKYGKDSYVLITGASSGLGRALAYQFAKIGFNLILVARRDNLLEEIKKEIEATYKVEVVVVGFDLAGGASYEQLEAGLVERVKEFDISILVNNAGLAYFGPLASTPLETIEAIVNVNLVAPTILTQLLTHKLTTREYKSAVVNISSGSGQIPSEYLTVYSATKAYLRFLTYAVGEEMKKKKIDFLNVNLGFTRTAMISNKKNLFTAEPEEAAYGIVRDIGKYRETEATFRQYMGFFIFNLFPFSWRISIMNASNKRLLQFKEVD